MEQLNIPIELLKLRKNFLRALIAEFTILVLSTELKNWHNLSWEAFLEECQRWHVNPCNSNKNWEYLFIEQKMNYLLLEAYL